MLELPLSFSNDLTELNYIQKNDPDLYDLINNMDKQDQLNNDYSMSKQLLFNTKIDDSLNIQKNLERARRSGYIKSNNFYL